MRIWRRVNRAVKQCLDEGDVDTLKEIQANNSIQPDGLSDKVYSEMKKAIDIALAIFDKQEQADRNLFM